MMPAAAATPVAPVAAAADGIFAGMLAQRLQPAAEPMAKAAPAGVAPKPSPAGALPPGQPSPQDGNLLPPQGPASAISEVDAGMPVPGLPLPLTAELSSKTGSDGMPPVTPQPDVAAEDLPAAGTQADAPAPLPVALTPPLTVPPDTRSQTSLADRPAPVDGRGVPPGQQSSPAALPLAELGGAQPAPVVDPRQRPASLGLNPRGETAEMLRGSIASLSMEQAQRAAGASQATQQTLAGDALLRQFQQQIDRLLATSRRPVSGTASAPLLTGADGIGSVSPPDPSLNAFLPGGGGEARGVTPHAPATLPALPVNTGVGHPGWSAELGQRMVWLANQEIREAKIQLNPRHLGPIDVRIVYSDAQQLSVSFNAQNPAAREALDAALPRLREMFEQQGLNLADASVSQESFAGQQRGAEGDADDLPRHAAASPWAEGGEGSPQRPPPVVIGQGLVDTFA